MFVGVVCVCKGEVEGGTIDSEADFFSARSGSLVFFTESYSLTKTLQSCYFDADFINY